MGRCYIWVVEAFVFSDAKAWVILMSIGAGLSGYFSLDHFLYITVFFFRSLAIISGTMEGLGRRSQGWK